MGCSASQPEQEVELRVTRPATARQRTSHRPQSRQTRPHSQARASSSRQHGTSHRVVSDRPRTRSGRLPPLREEQVPTDVEIKHDISTLAALIDEHAQSFYREQDAVLARREAGKEIIRIVTEGEDDRSVAAELSRYLEPYALEPSSADRTAHLQELCERAMRIKKKIRRHPAEWGFGVWDDEAVQFPSILADNIVVEDALYV